MSEELNDFPWTEISEKAAQMVAANRLTYDQIAKKLDISERTLFRWRQHAQFKARVDEILAKMRSEIQRVGIADMYDRVNELNVYKKKIRRIVRERAKDPELQKVPGGRTGLIIKKMRSVGFGESAMIVEEYEIDYGILKELRDHSKQAAQELGQWTEKKEVTGNDGGPIVILKLGESAKMDDL